jgi:hypothetical protein
MRGEGARHAGIGRRRGSRGRALGGVHPPAIGRAPGPL